MSDTTPGTALKITLIYLVFSVLWILWSDRAVLAFAVDTDTQALLQTVKGWLFVAVTSVGLYVLLSRSYRRTGDDVEALKRHQEALARSEQRYRSVVENMPGLLCRFTSDGVSHPGLLTESEAIECVVEALTPGPR